MTRAEIEEVWKRDSGRDTNVEHIINFALAMCQRQREQDAKVAELHLGHNRLPHGVRCVAEIVKAIREAK